MTVPPSKPDIIGQTILEEGNPVNLTCQSCSLYATPNVTLVDQWGGILEESFGVDGEECTEGNIILDSLNITTHGEKITCLADHWNMPQGESSVELLVQSNKFIQPHKLFHNVFMTPRNPRYTGGHLLRTWLNCCQSLGNLFNLQFVHINHHQMDCCKWR